MSCEYCVRPGKEDEKQDEIEDFNLGLFGIRELSYALTSYITKYLVYPVKFTRRDGRTNMVGVSL